MKRITAVFFCFLSFLLLPSTVLPESMTLPRNGNISSAVGVTRSPNYPPDYPLGYLPDYDAKIETKYDGFNNETVVTLKKMNITCRGAKGMESTLKDTCVSFVASLHCPGVQIDHVRYAKLQLIFETKHWDQRHTLNERELVVVADGETLKLGTMSLAKHAVETSQLIDVMREVLEVSLPYQTFKKIAQSQTVEMKVGKTMFELQEKNVIALRDLNNRVKL
jgi:hypothetical protein